jgi:squalene-hopene/tetraprenyl-beta-curcumene cyclase
MNNNTNLNILEIPYTTNIWKKMAWDALSFLVKQYSTGFAEALHRMPFPAEQGFSVDVPEHCGDIFQRALIADALNDADSMLNGQLKPMIDSEINYLISSRRNTGIGGWSYFPTLPELPPDTDDLAQIMSLLVKREKKEYLDEYCSMPLEVLLNSCTHSNGSFGTWIIPSLPRTPEQELQLEWSKRAWGMTADAEVIANLLYALALYDHGYYRDIIARGLDYLNLCMNPEGYWESTWYYGRYYGTYVCLRAFAAAGYEPSECAQAVNYIENSRNNDGGWGLNGISDPLNTSFALLALAAFPSAAVKALDEGWLGRSYQYLSFSRETPVSWQRCLFIKMQMGRAGGYVHKTISYGSSTITTAFVLKAAAAVYNQAKTIKN